MKRGKLLVAGLMTMTTLTLTLTTTTMTTVTTKLLETRLCLGFRGYV